MTEKTLHKSDGAAIRANCPAELKALAQWVCWKAETRGGKPTKLPYYPWGGYLAKANDSATWTDFSVAMDAFARGGYAGVGVMFAKNDPYCGVDLDNSLNPDGSVKRWAQEIVDLLAGGYCEVSPSKTGLKIWVKAKKPGTRCRKGYHDGEVEIYDRERYFTVTGAALLPCHEIAGAQEALEEVYEKVFTDGGLTGGHNAATDAFPSNSPAPSPVIEDSPAPIPTGRGSSVYDPTKVGRAVDLSFEGRLAALRREPKAADLFAGNWTNRPEYPSQSEADAALCAKLAFYFGKDAAAMDRAFRMSALLRPKWDEYRGKQKYGEKTIGNAIANCTATYAPKARQNQPPRRETPPAGTAAAAGETDAPKEISNHESETDIKTDEKGKEKEVTYFYRKHMKEILSQVLDENDADLGRVGDNLFYARERDDEGEIVSFIGGKDPLFGWLQSEYDVVRWKDAGLDADGISFVTQAQFYSEMEKKARLYKGVSGYPFHPECKAIFTRWDAPEKYNPDGRYLKEFVGFFNPSRDYDGWLIHAMVLSMFWGGKPGGRPLFVIAPEEEGSQQGIGKTTLAAFCAKLCGGYMAISPPKRGAFSEELAKQVIEEVNLTRRVVLLDNHTGVLRDDDLTSLITAEEIQARAAYKKRAVRLNHITWILTTNEPNFSTDVSSRVAIIRLAPCNREEFPAWHATVSTFIASNRDKIIADAIWQLARPNKPTIEKHTRFEEWDAAVLACTEQPTDAAKYILHQQRATDADDKEIKEMLHALLKKFPGTPHRDEYVPTKDFRDIWNNLHNKEMDYRRIAEIMRKAASRGLLTGSSGKPVLEKGRSSNVRWTWRPWDLPDYEEAIREIREQEEDF